MGVDLLIHGGGPDSTGPKHPRYSITNESLSAIMEGLQIQQGDRVLAVCGSGDQAFAMLELADRVVAFDCREEQVEFALYKLKLLERGEFEEFRAIDDIRLRAKTRFTRRDYFTTERLERIREHAGRLETEVANLYSLPLRFLGLNAYTKLYLSNAWAHSAGVENFEVEDNDFLAATLNRVLRSLCIGGLLYVTETRLFTLRITKFPLSLHEELSETALYREREGSIWIWNPAVYVKTRGVSCDS